MRDIESSPKKFPIPKQIGQGNTRLEFFDKFVQFLQFSLTGLIIRMGEDPAFGLFECMAQQYKASVGRGLIAFTLEFIPDVSLELLKVNGCSPRSWLISLIRQRGSIRQ